MMPFVHEADHLLPERVAQTSASHRQSAYGLYASARRANASRALAISFPTVHSLLGAEAFDAAVSRFAQACPHTHGDWGLWGAQLPSWLSEQVELMAWPYVPDVARLDWLCHVSERTQDSTPDVASLMALGNGSSESTFLRLAHDVKVLASDYPVAAIWWAHHGPHHERASWMAQARQDLAKSEPHHVLIHRSAWRATPTVISPALYSFLSKVLAGQALDQCLDQVDPHSFDFVQWLPTALREGVVSGLSD